MRRTIINNMRIFTDFNVVQYGHEDCRPGHSIGNFARSNHLIHYIHRGNGIYRARGREYALSAHDAFLIYPGEVTYYIASDTDPWVYSWVEFSGSGVSRFLSGSVFSEEPAAFDCGKADKPMLELFDTPPDEPYALLCALSAVLSAFSVRKPEPASPADEYIKAAMGYIQTFYYHKSISVEEVAAYVGIDRSYLFRIFKEKLGISPKRCILQYKLQTAAKLLSETNLPVGQAARSVGFDDPLYFSSAFHRRYGMSPTEYRRRK